MGHTSLLRRKWKLIINIATILALALLVYVIRGQLADTLHNLGKVNAFLLLLIVPVEALNYHAQTKLYQHLFGLVGNKLNYKYLLRASLELNFVNHVFPSGGVTGISYFGVQLSKSKNVSGGKATLVQVMKLGLGFLSFELLVGFGLLCLAVMGKVNNLTILVAAVLSTLVLVVTIGFGYIVGSKQRISSFFTAVTMMLNKLIQVFRRDSPETINIDRVRIVFDDFHDTYIQLRSRWQELKAPFWWAFLANVTEVMALYVVYIAFGHFVNLGAVILAYAVANAAGLVSVLPGGVGVYEALMTAVLVSAGVPAALSLPVTVMYRVVNTLIQIPPGYYLYQKSLHRGEVIPVSRHES